jgi:dephospho-CoA kinase
VIGVIGAIGSGKSHVSALLADLGALVLDADAVGHALLNQTPVRAQVVARFGERILDRSGASNGPPPIDRRALGAIVFAQPEALRALEAIVHPQMRKTFERAIARTVRRGKFRAVVLDAAILFEAGWDTLCDKVVCVDAPYDQRLARLSTQRGWTEEQLQAREQAQMPMDEKRRRADAVIDNDASPDALGEVVGRLWGTLLTPPRRATGPRALPPSSRGRSPFGTAGGPRQP